MANRARNNPNAAGATANDDLEALNKVTGYYDKNKKRINIITTVILVVVVGYFGYTNLYQQPREEKASSAMMFAQQYFQIDSMNYALNGDGQHKGFLNIIRKYKGTKAANLSNYYAGVCYLHSGDFNNAIKHLEKFNGKGTLVAHAAYGSLADAYMENGNIKSGIEYYNKATTDLEDELHTPMYLQRLGMAYEMDGQLDKAKNAYLKIQDNFPTSTAAQTVEKDLARVGHVD